MQKKAELFAKLFYKNRQKCITVEFNFLLLLFKQSEKKDYKQIE